MQNNSALKFIYSPSNLVRFIGCRRSIYLKAKKANEIFSNLDLSDDDMAELELFTDKWITHEKEYLNLIKLSEKSVLEIDTTLPLKERIKMTKDGMESGVDLIYQATFKSENGWRADIDFLLKVNKASSLGNHSYEPMDAKLARNPEPKHIIQLSAYSEIISKLQAILPDKFHILLGNKEIISFKLSDFFYYYKYIKINFENYTNSIQDTVEPDPLDCNDCSVCEYQAYCQSVLDSRDDLSLIANISKRDIRKLNLVNIRSIKELASTSKNKVAGLADKRFSKLHLQAKLQHNKRKTGKDSYEIIDADPDKGFARIPKPNDHDLFFDIEGGPLYPDRLEYLFGLYYKEDQKDAYKQIFGDNHDQEKENFNQLMNFLKDHLGQYPDSYIYHYSHYEPTALKRLSCKYAIHEQFLDSLLRSEKFVDLYRLAKDAVMISEPRYSIKNFERFYKDKERETQIKDGVGSIAWYYRWKKTGDNKILESVKNYNKEDCKSTYLLRNWLLSIKPDGIEYFNHSQSGEERIKSVELRDWEIEYEEAKKSLLNQKNGNLKLNARLCNILEFHKREDKPSWWKIFEREKLSLDEMIIDKEILLLDNIVDSYPKKIGDDYFEYQYSFQPQEHKVYKGSKIVDTSNNMLIGTVTGINESKNVITLKSRRELPYYNLSIATEIPILPTERLRSALYRFKDHLLSNVSEGKVGIEILSRHKPKIKNKESIPKSKNLTEEILQTVLKLDNSYLLIQGPPGTGKTYISADLIVDLISNEKKVGISSNSHLAIYNLLSKVETVADEKNVKLRAIRKVPQDLESIYKTKYAQNCTKKLTEKEIEDNNLFAGTAWLFTEDAFEGQLDYLFVDEAGQLPIANVIAMSYSAKNIVLIGDQMQLASPIQAVHPDEAGISALEFILDGQSTVPPEFGFFLPLTYRMNERISSFISDSFYDGRLKSADIASKRKLKIDNSFLAEAGIVLFEVNHRNCEQLSKEEAEIVKKVYNQLIGKSFIENDVERKIGSEDILIVTPYNMQVRLISSILPEGSRVGTVDKFQGQEAPIVIISMVRSTAEDISRNIGFIYSKNRLNVAISRAQVLAVMIFNPELLSVECKSIEDMRLLNNFCRLKLSDKYSVKIEKTR